MAGLFAKKAPAENPDYVTKGDQPSAAVGTALAASERHREAAELQATAQAEAPGHRIVPGLEPPTVREVRAGNEVWNPATLIIPPGGIVEIVGREPARETFDIVNQSSALNAGAVAVLVVLCRNRNEADRLASGAIPFKSPGRWAYLPNGAGRTLTHTAPMFAVADPAAADNAFLDLSTELAPAAIHAATGHHRAHH